MRTPPSPPPLTLRSSPNRAADGSGSIDREELAPLLRELGVSLSPTEMQEIFPLLDLDTSGDVGRDELAAWVATVMLYGNDVQSSIVVNHLWPGRIRLRSQRETLGEKSCCLLDPTHPASVFLCNFLEVPESLLS